MATWARFQRTFGSFFLFIAEGSGTFACFGTKRFKSNRFAKYGVILSANGEMELGDDWNVRGQINFNGCFKTYPCVGRRR